MSTKRKTLILRSFNQGLLYRDGSSVESVIFLLFQILSVDHTALTQISNLLVTLNSSVNFIIYCIYGDKFKKLFCQIFCRRCSSGTGGGIDSFARYSQRLSVTKPLNFYVLVIGKTLMHSTTAQSKAGSLLAIQYKIQQTIRNLKQ